MKDEIAVGDAYNYGPRHWEINYRKAEEWYKSAAGQGSGYAAYQIGQEYLLDHRQQTRGPGAHYPYSDPIYNMQMGRIFMLQSACTQLWPRFWHGWTCTWRFRDIRTPQFL